MLIFIALGGALGASCRFILTTYLSERKDRELQLGTLLVNIFGSFLIGVVYAWHLNDLLPSLIWSFSSLGFLASFTTFSSFSLEAVKLIQDRKIKLAITYILSTLLLSMLALILGFLLSQSLFF